MLRVIRGGEGRVISAIRICETLSGSIFEWSGWCGYQSVSGKHEFDARASVQLQTWLGLWTLELENVK